MHGRIVIASRGTKNTWPIGMLGSTVIPSPACNTYRNSLSCAYQSVSTRTTSIGATGRSIMLKIGVYTVSQPEGVWKFVAPRSAMAPAGVPMSSGTRNARITAIAASRESIGAPTKVTSSFIMPTLPTDWLMVTWKIGVRLPSCVCR